MANLKNSVIHVDNQYEKQEEKPVEFTHEGLLSGNNWIEIDDEPNNYEKVYYLGRCDTDGDMFSAIDDGCIHIFKGHLNSGKY